LFSLLNPKKQAKTSKNQVFTIKNPDQKRILAPACEATFSTRLRKSNKNNKKLQKCLKNAEIIKNPDSRNFLGLKNSFEKISGQRDNKNSRAKNQFIADKIAFLQLKEILQTICCKIYSNFNKSL